MISAPQRDFIDMVDPFDEKNLQFILLIERRRCRPIIAAACEATKMLATYILIGQLEASFHQ